MWKPLPIPGKPPPYNEIAHLGPDALKFVCALRAPSESNEEDWMAKLTPEQRALVEADTKAKRGDSSSSTRVCRMAQCKAVFEKLGLLVIEKQGIVKKISEIDDSLIDNNKILGDLSGQLHELETECGQLQEKVDLLRHKERVDLKRRSHDVMAQKHHLEREISQMEKNIEILINQKEQSARQTKGSSTMMLNSMIGLGGGSLFMSTEDPNNEKMQKTKKKNKKKHTGNFDMTASGVRKWSCCNTEEDELSGCGDEHSIGIKSTLLMKNRESYHPYEAMQKELSHQSMLAKRRPATALPSYGNKGFRDRSDLAAQSLQFPSMTKMKEKTGHGHGHNHSHSSLPHHHHNESKSDTKIHSILHKSGTPGGSHHHANHTHRDDPGNTMNTKPNANGGTNKSILIMSSSLDVGQHSVHFGSNSGPGTTQNSLTKPSHSQILNGSGSLYLNERSISAGSLLLAANKSVSSAVGKSRIAGSREVLINRGQGRPLTAHAGIHLKSTTTYGPASCLDSTCIRII